MTPTYTWVISKPDGSTVSGNGSVGAVLADQPGTYSCTFTAETNRDCPPQKSYTVGPETAQAVDIASVSWDEYAPESTPLGTCPNNGGKQVFPGKASPEDTLPGIRSKVALVATISPVVEGCTVHFKVWDVDDPFDQNNPNMPDVALIDGDTSGPDNRGTAGGLTASSTQTDANGEARVTFTVSMQPGDNFRTGASVAQTALDRTTQAQADANSPPDHVVFTDMLTVWRKLHIETDSMVRPTFAENTVSGQWDEPRFLGGQLWIDIPDQGNYDDLENGYIRIRAAGFPDLISVIIDHESSPGREPVRTNISEATWDGRPSSGSFVGSDDDLGDEALFTAGVVGSIIGVGIPPDGFLLLPDTSELQQVYQAAYILPVVETQHTSEGAYPFYRNFARGTRTNWDPGRLVLRGLPVSTANFWTVYVFSAFQPEASSDCDSEPTGTKGACTHEEGATSAPWIWGNSYTGMAAVFAETLRDGYPDFQSPRTVAHEIAHTLGVSHDGGVMDATDQGPAFLAQSLKRLREYVEP